MVPAPSPTPINSILDSEDKANEADMLLDGEEIGALEEGMISFRLSGPNESLSRNAQSDNEPASSGHSTLQSRRQKSRRRLTC